MTEDESKPEAEHAIRLGVILMSNTSALWNAVWGSDYPEWDELSEEILGTLRAEIGSLNGLRVLEAGSGTGRISCALALAGAEVWLLDYSDKALDKSREYFSSHGADGNFVYGDVRAMPFEDDSFDVVWSSGLLEHFEPLEQVKVLSEMVRITRNGGKVIVIVPYAGSPFYQLGKWWAEALGTWVHGTERPMSTLSGLVQAVPADLIREYTVASRTSLHFLNYLIPYWTALESLANLKIEMEPNLDMPGYLLVSVLRVTKEHKGDKEWWNDVQLIYSLTNKPILCLSSINWDFLWQRPQHLMERLARLGRKVVFINAQGLILNGLGGLPETEADFRILLSRFVAQFSQRVRENLFVVKPVFKIADKSGNHRDVLGHLLKQVGAIYDLTDYVCWVLSPTWVPWLRELPGNPTVVYDCVDEHAGFSADESIPEFEADLIERADIVFAASRALLESKRQRAKEIYYLPNGVCRSISEPPEGPSPEDIRLIPRPRIGFVGAIASWVDRDLIRQAAAQRPDYSFVLIGPAFVSTDGLDLPNIFLLGSKPYDVLPRYYRELDVGIIPFVEDNVLTKYSNPIKAYEYIAAGLPVVSTRIPELEYIPDLVNTADSPDEFVKLLDLAVAGQASPSRASLDRFWASYDWDHIAAATDRIMKAYALARHGIPEAALRQVEAVTSLYEYPKAIVNLYRRLSSYERTFGKPVIPLEIRGRSDTLILAFYEGDDQGARWKVALRSFLENCYHDASVTFALRVDPLETDIKMVIGEVSQLVTDAGFDLEGVSNVTLINDNIALPEMDRLLVVADAIIEPSLPSRRFLVERARAIGCAMIGPDGIESYLKEIAALQRLGRRQ